MSFSSGVTKPGLLVLASGTEQVMVFSNDSILRVAAVAVVVISTDLRERFSIIAMSDCCSSVDIAAISSASLV